MCSGVRPVRFRSATSADNDNSVRTTCLLLSLLVVALLFHRAHIHVSQQRRPMQRRFLQGAARFVAVGAQFDDRLRSLFMTF